MLIAYLIDMRFGEFQKIKHPVILMGEYITFFERKFYQDNRLRGLFLTVTLLLVVWLISYIFTLILNELLLAILASMFLAHNMLYTSVKEAIGDKKLLSYLVSRDTKKLNESDMNKALIETYAENLSDGIIAPLFYLLLFGFEGIVVYKAINTLDSMVGYKNSRYQNFGYVSAKLDDIANFIPSRLTAILIMLIGKNFNYKLLQNFASGHQSPNAGYPISAVALTHNLMLGGDTSYDGKILKKPYFGNGKREILKEDVFKILKIKKSVDIIVILILGSLYVVSFVV